MVNKSRASMLMLLVFLIGSSAWGQASRQRTDNPIAPGLIELTGEDKKRAKQLCEEMEKAVNADRWDEAIAKAEELLALRTRAQGPKHYETVDAVRQVKNIRQMAALPKDDRSALLLAIDLNGEGESFFGKGMYLAAQSSFQKALEIRRRVLGEDHYYTGVSYSNLGYVLNALGQYAAAQALYEKALEIFRRLLTEDDPHTATVYTNLASNLWGQGKYVVAQPLFEKALQIRQRVLGRDHPDTAAGYNNLAMNLAAQGKRLAAQPLFEMTLDINRRLAESSAATASSYNNLAVNLNEQGKYIQAQPLYEKALNIRRQLLTDSHPDTAKSYNNLARNLEDQGKYAEAQPLYEKALEIDRRLLSDDHPDTAISYNNLGHILHAQGRYAEAQPLVEKCLEINRRLLTNNHPDTASSLNNVAVNLLRQAKFAAAQPLLEQALDIRRRLLGDNHPDTASSYDNLARNLNAQGKYTEAQPLHEHALKIDREILGEDHPDTAVKYSNLARNFGDQGKYAAAQTLYANALMIQRRLLTDDHPYTAVSHNNLASILYAQGRYIEARDRLLLAVKSRDAARVRVAFTGLERTATTESPRPTLAAVLARLGQLTEAWQVLEVDLGRGLLDELAARQDRRLTAPERARLGELTSELEKLDKLVESTPKGLDEAKRARRFENLNRQRALASIALGELHTKLVQAHGALAGQVASLNEIQAALPPDAALVAWVDIPPAGPNAADPHGEHWGVVVRSNGIPKWVAIAGTGRNGLWTAADTGLASRVRTVLRARPGAGAADLKPLHDQLRSQRLAPLAKALGTTTDGLPPARRLVVLPSRAIAGIPVEVLLAPDDPRTVSYAPSGTVLKYLREQARADRHAGLLALGDPVYAQPDKSSAPKPSPDHGLLLKVVARGSNASSHGLKDGDVLLAYNGHALSKKDDLKVVTDGDKPIPVEVWRDGVSSRQELAPGKLGVVIDPRPAREAITEQRKLQQVLAAARSGGEEYSPLPGTRREVEAIARLFNSDDRPARALLDTDASEPELDRLASSGELSRFAFIHLATHGVIDEAIPQRSAVILTQIGLPDPLDQVLNRKPVFDGRLLVREIQRSWDLKAELVTLSACETALGRESGGEGFVGFTQALLMSGARSVCLSLWKVDDKATSLLMTRFYQNMLGKRAGLSKVMPKAEALQEAKHWLRTLTVDQVDGELAALERGEVRPLDREKGAPARREAPPLTSGTVKPYENPYFWAAFVLAGDPD
jgi:tetratricopeptide (TPR) repeat protein